MLRHFFCISFCGFLLSTFSQNIELNFQSYLASEVQESSALLVVGGAVYTINDSGGEPELYKIDTATGALLQTIVVENATNIDWEALASNTTHLFIGDFGNNSGNRTDLLIYKVPLLDIGVSDTVYASQIQYEYSEQTDFSNQTYQTNFDAEAMIATDDSLYLFSKNWANGYTNLYALPVEEGSYAIESKSELNIQSLATDAFYDVDAQTINLLSYNFTHSFLFVFGFNEEQFVFPDDYEVFELFPETSKQTEGLCVDESGFWISAEQSSGYDACLYKANFTQAQEIVELESEIFSKAFPNPSSGKVSFRLNDFDRVCVYNLSGQLLKQFDGQCLMEMHLNKGVYMVNYQNTRLKKSVFEKLIVM